MAWDRSSAPRQTAGIEINVVGDGYIVYQADRERVHYLNHTAALVLELCDGTITFGEIPGVVKTIWDLPSEPIDEVAAILDKLLDEGLVERAGGEPAASS